MSQLGTIQQLTNRLGQIETEIIAIRRELKAYPERQNQQPLADATIPYTFANKAALREQMQQLFLTLSIQGESVGAEAVQKQMRQAALTSNELSQSIIAAREE